MHHATPAPALEGFTVFTVGIAPERATLRERVERRTETMFASGLLNEVRGLLARGYDSDLRPLRSIGYRQAVAVVQGVLDADAARRDIVTETMRYAKRQMTWFRHQTQAVWAPDAATAHGLVTTWLQKVG
jgi:tRNA dimethylallyltransferase